MEKVITYSTIAVIYIVFFILAMALCKAASMH